MKDLRSLIPRSRQDPVPADEARPFFSLHRQIDRLFDDFFRDFDFPTLRGGWSAGWPNVEVADGDREVKVVVELPGLDEKDIDVTLRDGVLTLKGEKKRESKSSDYSERWHGQFARSINLGSEVDPDKVSAAFNKGVLTITLEKRPDAQRNVKKIAINRTD